MLGKNPRVNALESRKQLLIAESELNRAQLVHELTTLAREVDSIKSQAKTLGFIGSAAALFAGWASRPREKIAAPDKINSWGRTILNGAGLVISLWSEFRAKSKK